MNIGYENGFDVIKRYYTVRVCFIIEEKRIWSGISAANCCRIGLELLLVLSANNMRQLNDLLEITLDLSKN
jgi:hypothetical protein